MKRYGARAFFARFANSFANGLLFAKLRRRAWRSPFFSLPRRFRAGFLHVEPRKVLFETMSGDCSCNPRAIARELARRRPDADIVWILDDAAMHACGGKPDTGRAVLRWTGAAHRELATAKVFVENASLFVSRGNPPKRKGQRIMDTWHGSLGIKRLDTGKFATGGGGAANAAVTDLLLSNSDFEDTVFAASPLAGVPLLRTGHPRNDLLFAPEDVRRAVRAKVFAELGLPPDAKLALYAPTFRDDALPAECAASAGFGAWNRSLERRFGGNWHIALRLHPLDAKALAEGLVSFPAGALDATRFKGDMQELLLAADAGITDYSSWIYDYLLLDGRPGFIFAPDRTEYERSHGFCYPLEETPFPIAGSAAELCSAIDSFDMERFRRERRRFLDGKGCMEDGRASERAVDAIERWMDEGEGA